MKAALFLLMASATFAAEAPSFQAVRKAVESKSPESLSLFISAAGEEAFKKGQGVVFEGGNFLFGVESAPAPMIVINEDEPKKMKKGSGNLWTYAATLPTSRTHNFSYVIDGKPFGGRNDVPAFGSYSYEKPGVPRGTLSEKMVHTSKIYPGMESNWWI